MTPTENDRERARVYIHHHQDAPCVAECGEEIAQMLSDAREEGRREERRACYKAALDVAIKAVMARPGPMSNEVAEVVNAIADRGLSMDEGEARRER